MPRAKSRKKQKRRAAARRALTYGVGITLVVGGFLLPWLDYRCTEAVELLLGCPESQMIAGWRLPLFAHEAEQAWIVRVAQIFQSDDPDRSQVWLVYASPAVGLLGALLLDRRPRPLVRTLAATANAAILFLLINRLQTAPPAPPLPGMEVKYGLGLVASTVGHGVLCWAALTRARG